MHTSIRNSKLTKEELKETRIKSQIRELLGHMGVNCILRLLVGFTLFFQIENQRSDDV